MIRVSSLSPKAIEFTSFRKKEGLTDDELINAVMELENHFLAKQEGIIFHCLVRNFANEYANVLFVREMESLEQLEKAVGDNPYAHAFFSLMETEGIKMNFHHIGKENFELPDHFSCVEWGTFRLKDGYNYNDLRKAAENTEQHYLNSFSNTLAHFTGSGGDNIFSEVTLGQTLGQTKKICMGYLENPVCQTFLNMADEKTMDLDFWYVVA